MANSIKAFKNFNDWVDYENELARSNKHWPNLDWVKKLGVWHLSGGNGETICGKPMLGNNYAKYIPENERIKCPTCFK